MITGLDHIVLATPDLDAGIAAYRTVLGVNPSVVLYGVDGTNSAHFVLANTTLELITPSHPPLGNHLRAVLAAEGEGLTSLCFSVTDLEKTHRTLERRALVPGEITASMMRNHESVASWRRFRTARDASHGIRLFFIDRDNALPASTPVTDGPVTGLDHLVVSTTHPNRAAALYGARLGLDMALDRTNPAWGMRLMFFRCGDLIVEIAHRLDEPAGDAPDTFYGLTWRTADIEAAHARLAAASLDVSNIRPGRKPGTRVFTLKNGTLNVPTLFVGA